MGLAKKVRKSFFKFKLCKQKAFQDKKLKLEYIQQLNKLKLRDTLFAPTGIDCFTTPRGVWGCIDTLSIRLLASSVLEPLPTAPRVPKLSPIQVLSRANVALLPWSKGKGCFQQCTASGLSWVILSWPAMSLCCKLRSWEQLKFKLNHFELRIKKRRPVVVAIERKSRDLLVLRSRVPFPPGTGLFLFLHSLITFLLLKRVLNQVHLHMCFVRCILSKIGWLAVLQGAKLAQKCTDWVKKF